MAVFGAGLIPVARKLVGVLVAKADAVARFSAVIAGGDSGPTGFVEDDGRDDFVGFGFEGSFEEDAGAGDLLLMNVGRVLFGLDFDKGEAVAFSSEAVLEDDDE